LRSACPPADWTAASKACQQAGRISFQRASSSGVTGAESSGSGTAGAPKSVVAVPGRRAMTVRSDGLAGGEKASVVDCSTRAYRGA